MGIPFHKRNIVHAVTDRLGDLYVRLLSRATGCLFYTGLPLVAVVAIVAAYTVTVKLLELWALILIYIWSRV